MERNLRSGFFIWGNGMPIIQCTLPNGGKGWKWGHSGKCFASREDADKQARAAYANGYAGDSCLCAMDKSGRRIDIDGRLHVTGSHISKATVNPYYGYEIPDCESLGLDPDKVYQLLRDPDELEKSAPTFARLPILKEHVPTKASDHKGDLVIGAIGSDVKFNPPYLDADLCFWTDGSIAGIEADKIRELSCCYHYVPIMEPGEYQGQKYDGRMTQIQGNHLALVESGRAGSDVLVADSNPFNFKEITMKMTKLGKALFAGLSALSPKLAQDSAVPAIVGNAKRGVDAKAMKEKLLALDAEIDAGKLDDILDAIIGVEEDPEPAEPETPVEDESPHEKVRSLLSGKVDDDVVSAILALIPETAADEGQEGKKEDDEVKKEEDKKAMDAAINSAVEASNKRLIAGFEAAQHVRSVIGEVKPGTPAAEVYGLALDELKVDHKDIKDVAALRALFSVASGKAAEKPSVVAQDSAGLKDRFPNAARFGR